MTGARELLGRRASAAKLLPKRVIYQARVHRERLREARRRPRVVMFPSNEPSVPSSNLRGWLMAPELRKLGWRVVVVPKQLSLRQHRRIRLERPDVIFLQQTKHLLNQHICTARIPACSMRTTQTTSIPVIGTGSSGVPRAQRRSSPGVASSPTARVATTLQ